MTTTRLVYVLGVAAIAVIVNAGTNAAQTAQRATESESINGKKVAIEYSRPTAKDGKALGVVVPYGQVWSLGDAVLTTDVALKFDQCSIPPGTYNLFAVPNETPPWNLIIAKRQGTTHAYDKGLELCREKMGKSGSGLNKPPEQLSLLIIRIPTSPIDLGISLFVIQWGETRVDSMFSARP